MFFQLLKKPPKTEALNRHKIILKIMMFIFFKLKKMEIKYYITKREVLVIIKYLIEIKYFIIKYRYFIILYTNYQILKFIIKIEINIYEKIAR